MPLITLGSGNQLIVKVPSKGDTDWANDFKTEFAQKIVEHDHSGSGKGSKIVTAAIEDGAISNAKLDSATQTSIGNITTNASNIATNTAAIAGNTSDIATNISDISTLGTAIVSNATDIATNTGRNLGSISNVSSSTPSDNDVLTYDTASGEWKPEAASGGATVLNDLTNVNATPSSNEHVLRWSGSQWAANRLDLDNLGDVNLTSVTGGDTLVFVDAGGGIMELQNTSAGAGGGTAVDTISNQTEATAYSGTANTIVIDSTTDIVLDVDLINRTILCEKDINLDLGGALKNCTIKHGTENTGKYLDIGSKYRDTNTDAFDPSTGGLNLITNCSIQSLNLRIYNGYREAFSPGGADDEINFTVLSSCDVNCLNLYLGQYGGVPAASMIASNGGTLDPEIYIASSNVNAKHVYFDEYATDYGSAGHGLISLYVYEGSTLDCFNMQTKMVTSPGSTPSEGGSLFTTNGGTARLAAGLKTTSCRFWNTTTLVQDDQSFYNLTTVHSNNQVDFPHEIIAGLNSDQPIASSADTKINFDNSATQFGWDIATDRFEFVADGRYKFDIRLVINNMASGSTAELKIMKGGQASPVYTLDIPPIGTTTTRLFNYWIILPRTIAATSQQWYFEIADSGGSSTIAAGSQVLMTKLPNR